MHAVVGGDLGISARRLCCLFLGRHQCAHPVWRRRRRRKRSGCVGVRNGGFLALSGHRHLEDQERRLHVPLERFTGECELYSRSHVDDVGTSLDDLPLIEEVCGFDDRLLYPAGQAGIGASRGGRRGKEEEEQKSARGNHGTISSSHRSFLSLLARPRLPSRPQGACRGADRPARGMPHPPMPA